LLLLYVAWIQRTGAFLDPRPLLVLGSALVVAGIVGHSWREHRVS